ncbi:MAG: hypothetical protein NZN28_12615, partial [Meiothermus sp.]|uniref:hypothetical protein n=1 Tax=Meiothermus sp. TaxID=1955249 RepID=UPI0025D74B05
MEKDRLVRRELRGGQAFLVGRAGLMAYGAGVGSPKRAVSDGDTIATRALANIPLRFLGVDAPEKGLFRRQAGSAERYVPITDPSWDGFLREQLEALEAALKPPLRAYLQARVQPGVSANHAHHAQAATRALEEMVQDDLEFYQETPEGFRFYLAYAREALDGYGRLLCFAAPFERERSRRRKSYNQRMLEAAWVSPYFVWPNIDPFREQPTPFGAVLKPENFWAQVNNSRTLQGARAAVKQSRAQKRGLYEEGNPLQLLAFELRYLTEGRPPKRFVIDLTHPGN